MNNNYLNRYIFIIGFHVFIGFLIFLLPVFSKLYFLLITVYFLYKILNATTKDRIKEILIASAYITGAEVLFRMTGGLFFYESAKYLIILFMFIGMFLNGLSTRSFPYFLFLFLLIPSIIIASQELGYDLKFRSSVAFVLSGPVCLAFAALFCMDKVVVKKEINRIILALGLPTISMATYLFFYVPDLESVLSGTGSNFALSGGFGPNQVATVLGIGMFVFTTRFFLNSPTLFLKFVNAGLLAFISYRAIVTFSRGGVLTAIIMILVFLWLLYKDSGLQKKRQISFSVILLVLIGASTWFYSSTQTLGLIDKRYSNQDAAGRSKDDVTTGRVDIFMTEIEGFKSNPFFGVGASGMKKARIEEEGKLKASHNEVSRMLSEHGMFGVVALLILGITPLFFRLQNRNNIFFYSFLFFWFATINHSAMRIAAPGFIYALCLLNIINENHTIRRQLS